MAIKNIVVMTKAQAQSLLTNGSVTINSVTYTTADTIPCIAANLYYRHNLEVTIIDMSSNTRLLFLSIVNTNPDAMTDLEVENELMSTNQYVAIDATLNEILYFIGDGNGYFFLPGSSSSDSLSMVSSVTADNVELIQ